MNQTSTHPNCLSSADLEYIHSNAFAYTCKTPTHLDPSNSDSKPLFPEYMMQTTSFSYETTSIVSITNGPVLFKYSNGNTFAYRIPI